MRLVRSTVSIASILVAACDGTLPSPPLGTLEVVQLEPQSALVGTSFLIDIRPGFVDGRRQGLTYSLVSPLNAEVSLSNGHLSGSPLAPGIIEARIIARDAAGDTASQVMSIVVFAAGLSAPVLPTSPFAYSDTRAPIPRPYLLATAPGGSAIALSNTPLSNPTSDAGATLGRVLFYDKRLSANDGVACASCHVQQFGFSDTTQFSTGFTGGKTDRHASAIGNARFYGRGRFFWDERAATAEEQALMPIQNSVEMGLTLTQLERKLRVTGFYGPLFQAAFGTPEITSDRVARALAQYVRSIISYGSRFDSAFPPGAPGPDLARLTPEESEGLVLFNGPGRCAQCHATNAHVSDNVHNTGLDATVTDAGAGNGRFKSPSLRNVEVRGRFMHDGRFTSLEQVVEFYNSGVQLNPFLDGRLRAIPGGPPLRLNLSATQKAALVAYLRALTDRPLLTDPRFSNPFP
jgi:cytochrome c peroxidase